MLNYYFLFKWQTLACIQKVFCRDFVPHTVGRDYNKEIVIHNKYICINYILGFFHCNLNIYNM